jgi:hypothetical protein
MAYYPKSQIKTNLYTNGNEFVYKANQESYKGYYFTTSKGKFFTGKSPTDGTPLELLTFSDTEVDKYNVAIPTIPLPNIGNPNLANVITSVNDAFTGDNFIDVTKYASGVTPRIIPSYHKTRPTPEEFRLGKYNRYFCKKNNELIYIEISKETYTKLTNQDPYIAYDLYTPTSILWQDQPSLNFNSVILIEQNLNWYGFSQYFKGNFES